MTNTWQPTIFEDYASFLRLKLCLYFQLIFSSLGKTFKKNSLNTIQSLLSLTGHLQLSASGLSSPSGTSWNATHRTRSWLLPWNAVAAQTTQRSGSWVSWWRSEMEACCSKLWGKTRKASGADRREEVLQPCTQVLMWSIYLEKDKAHVYIHVWTCSLVVLQATLMLPNT